jgi:3-dehydro-L-gulonate 2-dehydrogenase
MEIMRIPFQEMKSLFRRILINHGFSEHNAEICAGIFAENSLEGIYSHGVNRFPRFVNYIKKGYVKVDNEPKLIHSAGAMEQWNGNLGPGPLNALFCTERAMRLADDYGLGCVGLGNTNHWMRGGFYGWKAAKRGYVFMGWTNTEANMPAWGAADSRLGNNPLVLAVPYRDEAVVLDFAMSMFSYGKMEAAEQDGVNLPLFGGYDSRGELTKDPGEILKSRRSLPVGYWKGAGLSLMLDILATIIASGSATFEVSKRDSEYGVSQVFIAISMKRLSNFASAGTTIADIVQDFKNSSVDKKDSEVRYPGERVLRDRKENLLHGIPVNKIVWEKIIKL